jgi:GT2 family glycosyltransferase
MELQENYSVAVLVLCTNEKHFMDDCMSSLLAQSHTNVGIYLLDNNSSDGSVEYVKEKFPSVKILHFESNLGYSKANNNGLKEAFDRDNADFCLVLNSDVKCKENMIEEMLKTYKANRLQNSKVGLIQPVILLYDEPEKLNTVGNAIHYLGFGYCKDYKKKYIPLDSDKEIIFASGAAMLVSKEYYNDVGLINEDFFLYYEDQNYSWRGLLKGYKHFVCAKAEMLHKYRFKSYPFKMYHSEKNRVMILLENYSWKTLLLLSPALALNAFFLFTHSIFNGWFKSKVRSVLYIFSHFGYIMKVRKHIQETRSVRDKELIRRFESRIDFEATDNKITKNIVSPLYSFYYKLIIKII